MLKHERLVPIKQAAALLPVGEYRPCYDTLLLWASRGLRGVLLETIWIGGRRYTSQQSVDRFIAATTQRRSAAILPGTIDIEASEAARQRLIKKLSGGVPKEPPCETEVGSERQRQRERGKRQVPNSGL